MPQNTATITAEQDALLNASRAILEVAQNESRELTPAERATIATNSAAFDTLEAERTAIVAVDSMTQSAGRRTEPRPLQSGPTAPPAIGVPSAGRLYVQMFGHPRDDQGWRSNGEFLATVSRGLNDHRLMATSVEHTGTAGGYLVPATLTAAVLDKSLQDEVVRGRATIFPMSSNELVISGRDTQNRAGGDVAGLKLVWLGENMEGSVDDPIFRPVNLIAKKAVILSEASVELVQDAINFEQQLTQGFAESLRVGLDSAFLRGDGVGKPLGILNSPCRITVAVNGQAADTITFANIRAMMSRLLPGSFNRAVWIAHPSVLDQLLLLHHEFMSGETPDTVASGALIPSAFQMGADGNWRLMGKPVLWTECGAELGDEGDLMLCDLSYYAVGLRRDMSIETTNAAAWNRFAQSFRMYIRLTGQPLLATAITPVVGTTTLSPFITLDNR